MRQPALHFQQRWHHVFDFSQEHRRQVRHWQEHAHATDRRRVFCAPDVFSPGADALLMREALWQLIEDSPDLDWLLLTDFPELARDQFPADGYWRDWYGRLPLNVLIGMRCNSMRESQRLPHLLSIPAQRRFIVHDQLESALLYPFAHIYRRQGQQEEEMMRCKRCGAGVWDTTPRCQNCHSEYKLEWSPGDMLHWALVGLDDALPASEQDQQWAEQLLHYYHQIGIPCFSRPGQLLHLQQLPDQDDY